MPCLTMSFVVTRHTVGERGLACGDGFTRLGAPQVFCHQFRTAVTLITVGMQCLECDRRDIFIYFAVELVGRRGLVFFFYLNVENDIARARYGLLSGEQLIENGTE